MSDPKPGDRVTPENVANLPIGTVVRFNNGPHAMTAAKFRTGGWLDSDGDILTDDSIADPEESPAHIVTLGPLHKIATAVAHLTHAARTDGAHHKQHDVCEALKVLLSAEDYAALGIVDEGVPS